MSRQLPTSQGLLADARFRPNAPGSLGTTRAFQDSRMTPKLLPSTGLTFPLDGSRVRSVAQRMKADVDREIPAALFRRATSPAVALRTLGNRVEDRAQELTRIQKSH
jgi:hypothetical protein